MKTSYFGLISLLVACFVLLTSCAPIAQSDNSEAYSQPGNLIFAD